MTVNLPALRELPLERIEAGLVLRSEMRRWKRGSGYLERAKNNKTKQKKHKIILPSFSARQTSS